MANGGDALGRDEGGRVIFVPFTIPGETADVEIVEDKGRFAHGRLLDLIDASSQRAEPRCPHFGVCGGCHWQHIEYEAQLAYKRNIVRDQLQRIGRIEDVEVRPTLTNPEPWRWGTDVSFSPTPEGGLGFWSPFLDEVMPIEVCYIIRPELLELFQDVDLALPGLRRLTLRLGDDGAMLVALEVEDVEPPQLATDFPVSAAMVLPDGTAANLVGDNYVVKHAHGRDFRVSAGSFFYPNPAAAAQIIDTVLEFANLRGAELVLEAYSGVGMLTSFLAPQAAELIGIEASPDAISDASVNLEETENVTLYEGTVGDTLPGLLVLPDVVVVDPPEDGLAREGVELMDKLSPSRLVYVSSDIATLARDMRQLRETGLEPRVVQPIDMMPQTFHVHTVALMERDSR
jgi:23S rRNA (uracil1939-C5)-methyltransferase